MIVELPSGAKVTMRDKLTAKDKFAVQKAITLNIDTATGMQAVTAGVVNDQRNALLTRVIESWTVEGVGIPSQQEDALDELDIDDYLELCRAVEPLLNKVVSGGVPNPLRPSSS
jgi:hypothetical protein